MFELAFPYSEKNANCKCTSLRFVRVRRYDMNTEMYEIFLGSKY